MQASRFEYKHRFLIHAVIYLLAFQAPWNNFLNLTDESTWLLAANMLWRHHLLSFMDAANLILVFALVFMALAAWLRTWGSAYVGTSVVHSDSMHGDAMFADGPYRRTRNPLYLGTLLHTIGLAILMTPSGAIFAIALIWIFQFRLALAEEPFLTTRFSRISTTKPPCRAFCLRCVRVSWPPASSRIGCRPCSASYISSPRFWSSLSSVGISMRSFCVEEF